MLRTVRHTAGLAASFLLGFSGWAQVFNPSPPLILLPPQSNQLGAYFASSQPTESEVLTGADVFLRNGSGIHRLTNVANHGDTVMDFAVSDDGALIAYTTANTQGVSILHTPNGQVDVVPNPFACLAEGCPPARLHFTSDAKYLLFDVTQEPSNETPSWGWPLYVVRLADGRAVMLARGELNDSGQRVVSDDGKVVFVSADPAATIALPQPPVNVYTINLDKTGLKQLTSYGMNTASVASAASIDKCGSLITFQASDSIYQSAQATAYRAYRIHSDGTGVEPLGASSQSCSSPTLAANGERIAFVCDGGKLYLAAGHGNPNVQSLVSFPYSTLDHLLLDEKTNQLLFTSGPKNIFRYGELGAIFGIDLSTQQVDKIQFPRQLTVVNNTDIGGALYPVPGGVITVEANNLRSNSFFQAIHTPLPDTLAGATLYVDGKPAPIFSIGPWEMTAQLPWATAAGKTSFQVKFADGTETRVLQEQVAPNSPWVEGFPANNNFGCQAAAYHAGTTQLADQTHPADIGETVDIITSGLGPTTPMAVDGVPTPTSPAYLISGTLTVYLDSSSSEVKFARLEPGAFGKYQVGVVVPPVTATEVQITLQMNGSTLVSNECIFFAKVP